MPETSKFIPEQPINLITVNNINYVGRVVNVENGFLVLRLTNNNGPFTTNQLIHVNLDLIVSYG